MALFGTSTTTSLATNIAADTQPFCLIPPQFTKTQAPCCYSLFRDDSLVAKYNIDKMIEKYKLGYLTPLNDFSVQCLDALHGGLFGQQEVTHYKIQDDQEFGNFITALDEVPQNHLMLIESLELRFPQSTDQGTIKPNQDSFHHPAQTWEKSIRKMNKLSHLTLSNTKLHHINFARALKSLQSLTIQDDHHLASIDGLSDMTNLQSLKILNCQNMTDYKPLYDLKGLVSLEIEVDFRSTNLSFMIPLKEQLPETEILLSNTCNRKGS